MSDHSTTLAEYKALLLEQLEEVEKFEAQKAKAQSRRIRTRQSKIVITGKELRKRMIAERV